MKKNIRIASILLVIVLATSCFVGTTFAKYTTGTDEVTDSARVAKWGVTITADEFNGFATSYTGKTPAVTANSTFTNDVNTDPDGDGKDLVAPGTSGVFGGVEISGEPEVAVSVTKTADLVLTNWTVDDEYYCPLKITVGATVMNGMDYDSAAEFEEAVEAAITAGTAVYAPNTDLSTFTVGDISWEWAFTGGVEQTDALDTALGDAATAATISLTVDVQIDQVEDQGVVAP